MSASQHGNAGEPGAVASGDLVADRYEVRRMIGDHPAYAELRAFDREVEVDVALWAVKAELYATESRRDDLIRRAAALRDLRQANVRRIFAATVAGGALFVTAQPATSNGLAQRLASPIAVTDAELLRFTAGVYDALAAAHVLGHLHGWLVPEDVVLVSGLVKVGGLGLWGRLDPDVAADLWCEHARYVAPEVLAGEDPSVAADMYSSAVILAELACGSETTATVRDVRDLRDAVSAVRPDVATVLMPSLSDAPADRLTDPAAVLEDLRRVLIDDRVPTDSHAPVAADDDSIDSGDRTGPHDSAQLVGVAEPPVADDRMKEELVEDSVDETLPTPIPDMDDAVTKLRRAPIPPSVDGMDVATDANGKPIGAAVADPSSPGADVLDLPLRAEPTGQIKLLEPGEIDDMEDTPPPDARADRDRNRGTSDTGPAAAQSSRGTDAAGEASGPDRGAADAEATTAAGAEDGRAELVHVIELEAEEPPEFAPPVAPFHDALATPVTDNGDREVASADEGARSTRVGGEPESAVGAGAVTAGGFAQQAPEDRFPAVSSAAPRAGGNRAGASSRWAIGILSAVMVGGGAWLGLSHLVGDADRDQEISARRASAPRPPAGAARPSARGEKSPPASARSRAIALRAGSDLAGAPAGEKIAADATPTANEAVASTRESDASSASPVTASAAPPTAGAAIGGCPDDMVLVGGVEDRAAYCIDRYEAPGVGKRPQTQLTLAMAKDACNKLGRTLCSPKQWEHACRGPNRASYPYGHAVRAKRCNVSGGAVHVAGERTDCRSASGAYDMSGNVAEWVAGGWVRGGSAADKLDGRCSRRSRRQPSHSYDDVGYRCCRSVPP